VETSDGPAPVPIWLRPERAARGPRPAHSRAEIAAAAIRIADAEGLDAASMRRVAGELGTGAASLYRYVAHKDELFELMVDTAIGEHPPPAPTGDWRADLSAIAHQYRTMALRHTWLVALPTTRPALGPHSLDWLEAAYAAADPLGLDPDDALARVGTLLTFARGHVIDELAESSAARGSGMDIDTWMGTHAHQGGAIFGSGRYPRLTRIMLEARTPHLPDRYDRAFQHGLDLILDGLASRTGARLSAPSRSPRRTADRGRRPHQ
jgi:AcrR family transcriptional regulator